MGLRMIMYVYIIHTCISKEFFDLMDACQLTWVSCIEYTNCAVLGSFFWKDFSISITAEFLNFWARSVFDDKLCRNVINSNRKAVNEHCFSGWISLFNWGKLRNKWKDNTVLEIRGDEVFALPLSCVAFRKSFDLLPISHLTCKIRSLI